MTLDIYQRITDFTVPQRPTPWLMDVDGVLNAIGKHRTNDWPEWTDVRVKLGSSGGSFPITYAPGLIRALNAMIERNIVDLMWLTTWEKHAARWLSPAIGLNAADARVLPDRWKKMYGHRIDDWWKARQAKATFHKLGAPMVWTDDDLAMYDYPIKDSGMLAISPIEDAGLTPAHLHSILDHIAQHTESRHDEEHGQAG